MIANIITVPPIKTLKGGISFKKIQTHIGPQIVSININNPIVADVIVLEPIVMHIKPSANCGTPKKKPIRMSWLVNLKDSDKKIADLMTETIATLGENITISKYIRFAVGESDS